MNITYKMYHDGYTITTDLGIVMQQYGKNSKPIDKFKTIEENCNLQVDIMYIDHYAEQLYRKEITEADIPKQYLERVKAIVDERIQKDSEYSQAQYDTVIAELVMEGRL